MTTIARALTTRVRRATSNEEQAQPIPTRAGTLRNKDYRAVDRAKISLPVSLISTTNALAYDAPDLPRVNTIISPSVSSTSSRRSYEESDSGASSATSISTPSFSREGSPVLGQDHMKGYFQAQVPQFMDSPISMTPLSPAFKEIEIPPIAPSVPSRALSHTKKTHQALASKRSMSRLSGENISGANSRTASGELPRMDEHPFAAELAQVMEVAEEFGNRDNVRVWDEEEQFLENSGYGRFSAEDYMSEIQPLFGKAFYDTRVVANTAMWL